MKSGNPDPAILAQPILDSRKYRSLNLPPETVIDLIQHALDHGLKPDKAVDDAREKLHNIIAPYLGDPDYAASADELTEIGTFPDEAALKEFSLRMLQSHASTKERIPVLDDFYRQILSVIGNPSTILDLACAMQPFAHPWMGLPSDYPVPRL